MCGLSVYPFLKTMESPRIVPTSNAVQSAAAVASPPPGEKQQTRRHSYSNSTSPLLDGLRNRPPARSLSLSALDTSKAAPTFPRENVANATSDAALSRQTQDSATVFGSSTIAGAQPRPASVSGSQSDDDQEARAPRKDIGDQADSLAKREVPATSDQDNAARDAAPPSCETHDSPAVKGAPHDSSTIAEAQHTPASVAASQPVDIQEAPRTAIDGRPDSLTSQKVSATSAQANPIASANLAVDDLKWFVPARGSGGSVFASVRDWLRVHEKGMTLPNFAAKRPAKDGLNGTATAMHQHFGYDAAPVTDVVNAVASGSTAIASRSIQRRYQNKVDEMLQADVAIFEANKKSPPYKPDTTDPGNPALPGNLILTKQNPDAQWQYDRKKLERIARDTSHPVSQHARDVLTAMYIAECQGKRSKGALYHGTTSALSIAAGGALIGGSHGLVTPLVASGHLMNAVKEALDLKKPFVEGRQNMRNEKASEIQRYVDMSIAERDDTNAIQDPQLRERAKKLRDSLIEDPRLNEKTEKLRNSRTDDPTFDRKKEFESEEELTEAKAGVYASLYDNASRAVADQRTFGTRLIAGRQINENKAKVHKDSELDIVVKHITTITTKGVGRVKQEQPQVLQELAAVNRTPGQTRSERGKRALTVIDKDATLKLVHTLLTDTGIPEGDAAILMSTLSQSELEKPKNAGPAASTAEKASNTPLSDKERLTRIAGTIGQPGLNPKQPADSMKDSLKKHLGQRS
jgi:hypothetical protein